MPESGKTEAPPLEARPLNRPTILLGAALLVGLGIWFALRKPSPIDCHEDFGPLFGGAIRTGFMKFMAVVSWGAATSLVMHAAKRKFSIPIVLTLFTVVGLIWGYFAASDWSCINP